MAVRFRIAVLLIYLIMSAPASCDLRQMCDTDHLTVTVPHFLHHIRHTVGYFTGNSGIDLIKYNCRQFHRTGDHRFDRKHHTRDFTSGSNGRYALQRSVLVGGEQEVDSILPLYARFFLQSHLHLEADVGHTQRDQPFSQLFLHFTGGCRTGFCQHGSLLLHPFILGFLAGSQFGYAIIIRGNLGQLTAILVCQGHQFFKCLYPMLLLQGVNQIQTIVHFVQTGRIKLDGFSLR